MAQGQGELARELALAREALGQARREIERLKTAMLLREEAERMSRHDLRTPLTAVAGFARLLQEEGGLTPRQREFLGHIEDAGRRMQDMIDLTLALYRMEAGTFTPETQEVDLGRLVAEVAGELVPLARGKDVRLQVVVLGRPQAESAVPPEAPEVVVEGSAPLFHAMLGNIIKNGLEASPRGEVVRVELSLDPGPDLGRARVEVANQGAVPKAIRESFLSKYTSQGKPHGTGLGVYNARLIAESHGGETGFTTSEAQGTRVWISLPLAGRSGAAPGTCRPSGR